MNGTLALTQDEDGTVRGSITIGAARWTITRWRRGSDEGMRLFEAEEEPDDFVDRFVRGETP